jgi:hypothetical protein
MIENPAFQNSMSTAVGSMWLIEESPAATVEEVKEQEWIYETLRENLTRRYARLADLATATYFGLEVDRTHWKALADYAAGRITYVPPQFQNWLDEASGIAAERRFFHWELEFPREALGKVELDRYVEEHGHTVPRKRFGRAAWSLESQAVDDLMAKVREKGVPLAEFAGVKPYRGVLTGLNEAFPIDTPTKERLVREDPRSAEIIKPYLRGQDIKRWSPEWNGLWMIVLKSSSDHHWPWSDAGDDAEDTFRQTYPSLQRHLKPLEDKLRKRPDKGWYWWELRSCAYYDAFEQPKIIHTDITWRPQFAVVQKPTYLLNTAYLWPAANRWLLAVVNSPLLWAYMWRNATHGKDEALRLIYSFTETLPIAPPTDEIQAEVESAVERLISLSRSDQEARWSMLDWLRTEFGVQKPGQKLEDFASLAADAFVEEVRKRRPKSEGRLSPAALKDLRAWYEEQATQVREERAEAANLERRLSDLVNQAYGLTPEEVVLLWSTAPTRMPKF